MNSVYQALSPPPPLRLGTRLGDGVELSLVILELVLFQYQDVFLHCVELPPGNNLSQRMAMRMLFNLETQSMKHLVIGALSTNCMWSCHHHVYEQSNIEMNLHTAIFF